MKRRLLLVIVCQFVGILSADAQVRTRGWQQSSPTPTSEPTIRRVSGESNETIHALPRDHGQQWKQYDISSFTNRPTNAAKPEQMIIDWILRETGTEAWFSEPLGVLSANKSRLRVYHTPETQRVVAEIVDRFVRPDSEKYVCGLRIVTISSPNWRTKAMARMQPVSVQSPGVEAWLITREDAAVIYDLLRRRNDFREHNSPNLLIRNGETHQISRIRPVSYIKDMTLNAGVPNGYLMQMGQVDEGFAMSISTLLTQDEQAVDAVIQLSTTQIERLEQVAIPTPIVGNSRQTSTVQVPQTSSWRLHERFRWPTNRVLVISCGVVAEPGPERGVPMLQDVLGSRAPRADALVFLEAKGRVGDLVSSPEGPSREAGLQYRGRY